MCTSYQEIIEKDVGLLSKKTIEDINDRSSKLEKSKHLLEVVDHGIKQKQREQLEEIYETLRQSDLMVDNRKVSFTELLNDQDLPTAIRLLISVLKQQTVKFFSLESQIC
jgi:hypothetical protein